MVRMNGLSLTGMMLGGSVSFQRKTGNKGFACPAAGQIPQKHLPLEASLSVIIDHDGHILGGIYTRLPDKQHIPRH